MAAPNNESEVFNETSVVKSHEGWLDLYFDLGPYRRERAADEKKEASRKADQIGAIVVKPITSAVLLGTKKNSERLTPTRRTATA